MITMITTLTYHIVSDIKGVFNTPMWLGNFYHKVTKFWESVLM